MKKTTVFLLAALASACGASAGVTATWTGAADAYWTNAANWLVEGDVPAKCPGALMYADADPDLPSCDEAVFDATCTSGRTTIDLDGLYSVSNVIVRGAECPKYTFGSSTDQKLMIEVKGHFTVESTVPAESCPVVDAELGTGNFVRSVSSMGQVLAISNYSAGKLVFNSKFATHTYRSSSVSYAEGQVRFYGSGDLEFNALLAPPAGSWLVSYVCDNSGTWWINNECLSHKIVYVNESFTISIAEGCKFGSFIGNNVGIQVNNDKHLVVNGKGTLMVAENKNAKFSSRGALTLNGSIDVYSKIGCRGNVDSPHIILDSGAGKSLSLHGEADTLPGGFLFHRVPYLTVECTNSLGNCGAFVVTNANPGAAVASFRWTGSKEQESLTVPIAFHGPESSAFAVRNAGTLPFTLSSTVTAPDGAKTLMLDGIGAPVVFNATLPSQGIALKLFGEVTVPDGASLANCTAVAIQDGASVKFEGTSALTLPPVSVSSGANSISFTGAKALTFSDISITGGTLDIRTADTGAAVVFAGKTSASAPISGLKINGAQAAFDDDGSLVPRLSPVDGQIAARGDVVPNTPSGVVGITSAGSGEADTLAADATAVAGIVQQNAAAAEIAIGAGQTLTAGEVAIDYGFGNFAVGSVAGQGALAAASSPLVLRNDSLVGALTVNAALASPGLEKTGEGDVSLLGGMTPDVGGMWMRVGETSLEGGEWNTTSSSRIVVTNGAVLSIGGDARVISAAGAASVDKSIPTIDVEGGLLKIGGNAVVTNRIALNHSRNGQISAIHQTGGTLYAQGDTVNNFYMFDSKGSGYSQGYWDISGGNITLAGRLAIGYTYSNVGIHQSGGKISGETVIFRLGAGSYGCAEFVMTGGTNSFANMNLRDWGNFNGTRAVMTIDGADASMEVRAGVSMVYENYDDKSMLTCGMLNLAAGVFRANYVVRGGNGGGVKDRTKSIGYINFNGGTFKTRVDVSPSPSYGIFGSSETAETKSWVDYVTIYAGGAVIETDESNRKVYISNPLRAPTGKGVASIDFANYTGKKTGLVAPPAVVIEGDGQGASAYAQFDAETGSITGIRVVSPGWGYTTATAKLYYGSLSGNSGVSCPLTLADVVSGGLTKKGEGKLFLAAVNTYTGETVLKGGTLSLYTAGALPEGSVVAYEGGALESKAAAFPSSIKVRIPGAETDSVRSHLIATFTDSLPAAAPQIEVVNSPAGTTRDWRVQYGSGNKLYARRVKGLSIIIY